MDSNVQLVGVELQTELAEVKESIKAVEKQIAEIESKLESALPEDTHYLREEKKQLREKEKQLREEKKQLREKELILLPRQMPGVLLQLQQKVDVMEHKLMQQELQEYSISKVGSQLAEDILEQLKLPLRTLQLDSTDSSKVDLPPFSSAAYSNENHSTAAALCHIRLCLEKHSVKFGPEGFEMLDLHNAKSLFRLEVGHKVLKGGVDGAIVPHSVHAAGAKPQLRCVIELKRPDQRKALQTPTAASITTASSSKIFNGTVRGQALMEALATAVFSEHPNVMLFLTDMDITVVIKFEQGRFYISDDVSFGTAIGILAGFLNCCSTDPEYQMDTAETSDPAMESTRRIRKKLRRYDSALLEQVSSVLHPDMSMGEKFFTALEVIQAYRPEEPSAPHNMGDWQFMYG